MVAGVPVVLTTEPWPAPDAGAAESASHADTTSAAGQPAGRAAGRPANPSSDPETLLADYDNALACARDQEVFTEIDEEFEPKLDALSREHRARAHRTRQRHAARIAALAQPGRDGAAP